MALTVSSRYINPPNFDGTPPVIGGFHRITIQLTAVGTAAEEESKVKKIDLSTLTMPDGTAPTSMAVEKIVYDINGMDYVLLEFDRTTDAVCAILAARGVIEVDIVDNSAGDTGDLLLTTSGSVLSSAYNIIVTARLK